MLYGIIDHVWYTEDYYITLWDWVYYQESSYKTLAIILVTLTSILAKINLSRQITYLRYIIVRW